ncbi:MAG TPA: PQQ-binding-like beta-propeller repeat protein, partial [Steroidobacteraceae bacterium]|nr:PQQ-binding-like beta-propeller repeat protein [Steroidobacteraceae bacterium]
MSICTRLAAAAMTLSAALLAGAVMAQDASPGASWTSYNNSLDGQRYSPLKQINTGNASQLGEVCRVQIDGPTSFHAGLIVRDGVIYTGTARETVAMDAATCALRWKFAYQPDEERCGGSSRGVALLDGRVFRGTCDGRLVALDAATGKLLWKNVIASPRLGESTSGAPLAWQGVVYMGISGSDLGIRGRVLAFDAATGKELWRFNTIPMGKETGAETWKRPESAKTGGGGVWGAMSLDVSRGELFVPVGNPWPDLDSNYRPGENLFTNSVVVLDARTGGLKWWHQVSPGDWMDLDLTAAPMLYRPTGARDLLAIGGKDGHVTVIDRDTHNVVFRVPVTTVEQIKKPPTNQGSRMCPGFAGGVEWNGPAMDWQNSALVVGAVDICFIIKLAPNAVYKPGEADWGGTVEPTGEATGWIHSLDSQT